MRIDKLHLTNFRSFAQTQVVHFAPVTLLFGPNSVGKSTVLLALFYIQQILSKGQCDPLRIDALGDKYVGGFKNLVNKRDLAKTIIIKVEFIKGDAIGSSYSYLSDFLADQLDLQLANPSTDAEHIGLELEIAWSESESTAYVARYQLWLDHIEVAEARSDAGLKQPMITNLNYLHPLLLPVNHDVWLVDCFDQQLSIHSSLIEKVFSLKGIYLPSNMEISEGAVDPISDIVSDPENTIYFTDDCYVSEFHELLNHSRIPNNIINNVGYKISIGECGPLMLHAPIGFKGMPGSLPLLGRPIVTSIDFDTEQNGQIVNEILSGILVSPLDDLLKILNESICIGPLRNIPDPTYQANPYPQQKDWHNGMAAWDVLDKADIKLLKSVDDWMSAKDKLDLGYGLAIKVEKRFAEFKQVTSLQSYQGVENQLNYVIGQILSPTDGHFECDEEATSYSYSIWDLLNSIDVKPNDIGVGVSQLLPLVVAAFTSRKGIVAIEQPELHIHPRVQVAVGDLLTQLDRNKNFLVETHSEHLILRLLKRIRQTSDGELPEGLKGVAPQDVSIVYLESSEQGVSARRIEIDEEGEFVGRWPQGFFAERREELM